MARTVKDPNFYPCGDPRSEENTMVRKDGTRRCRACARKQVDRWQAANPEKVKANQARMLEKYRETKGSSNPWYHEHKEESYARMKEWRRNNPEKVKAINRRSYERKKLKALQESGANDLKALDN